jgi:hypothetical protein
VKDPCESTIAVRPRCSPARPMSRRWLVRLITGRLYVLRAALSTCPDSSAFLKWRKTMWTGAIYPIDV